MGNLCCDEEHKYRKQKHLEGKPIEIPNDALLIIKDQSYKGICQIEHDYKEIETAFFCGIPFPDNYQLLPVLITSNKIINKDDIINGKKIKLLLDETKLKIDIKIDSNRKNYIDEKYGVTIIEIKSKDGLDINSFLNIDNKLFEEDIITKYRNESVYMIYYEYKSDSVYSSGIIKNINKENIEYSCQSQIGSSGCPILNLNTYKVIGIHKEGLEREKYNKGLLLKEPIKKFKEKYNNYIEEKNNIAQNSINNEFIDEII